MKTCFATALVCLLLVFSTPTAQAEQVNMGQISCTELLEFDEEAMAYFYFWLDGYFSAKSGNLVLDTSTAEDDLEALIKACRKSPAKKVLTVIQE